MVDRVTDEMVEAALSAWDYDWLSGPTEQNERSAMRHALEAALSEPEGWQDMSSAPRDGTTVLAYFPLEGLSESWCRVVPVYWSGDSRRWAFASRAASGFSKGYLPSKWMPLPAAPIAGDRS
jgi:hypothetical protein